jgi:hypothetical protein
MRWVSDRSVLAGGLAAAFALVAHASRADGTSEPSYGRVEGDLELAGALGAVVAQGGVRPEAELRVRYLESAGVFATYEDGPLVGSSAEPQRMLAAGAEVRPFFLYRWLRGHETRRATFDLVVDSIGIELGATWAQPAGQSFASLPGVELGLGVELPLLASATGPWIGLHGGLRWSDAALATGSVSSADDRAAYLAITVAWHQIVATHLVDVGDEAPE